jgi:flagellar protein FliJ
MSAPFRFGLERVRDLRAHDEELAKERFAASLSQRLRGEAILRAAEEQLHDARIIGGPAPHAPLSGLDLVARQAWVERLERSKLDKLEERQRQAHVADQLRREGAALDEMALGIHRRRFAA